MSQNPGRVTSRMNANGVISGMSPRGMLTSVSAMPSRVAITGHGTDIERPSMAPLLSAAIMFGGCMGVTVRSFSGSMPALRATYLRMMWLIELTLSTAIRLPRSICARFAIGSPGVNPAFSATSLRNTISVGARSMSCAMASSC